MTKHYFYLAFLMLLISCTTFREVHYFKDKIKEERSTSPISIVPNYYRVNIKGWSFMSSSRYLSGYFDQNSVNEYFNEIPQPEKGTLFTSDNKVEADKKSGDGSTTEASKKASSSSEVKTESGSELVIILSTNSEAIATQIKNTAVNNDVLKSLTLLANKDKLEEANTVKKEIANVNTDISLFVLGVDNFINSLKDDDDMELNKLRILNFLKSEFKALGIATEFDDLDELKKWYHDNY